MNLSKSMPCCPLPVLYSLEISIRVRAPICALKDVEKTELYNQGVSKDALVRKEGRMKKTDCPRTSPLHRGSLIGRQISGDDVDIEAVLAELKCYRQPDNCICA